MRENSSELFRRRGTMNECEPCSGVFAEPTLADLTQYRRDLHQIPKLTSICRKPSRTCIRLSTSCHVKCSSRALPRYARGSIAKSEHATAIRTDMDALPVTEKSGVPFCSTHDGQMHACGHDGHMAMALGLARHIAAHLDELERSVLIVFQPAEETTGGAQFICESGVFEKYHVDRIFGFHLWPDLPKGQIASRPGALLAATSESTFTFFGKPRISPRPKMAPIPWRQACASFEAYDYMAKRAQEEPCTFKCGLLESGQARNVISSRTYIEGTLRTFSEKMGAEAKAALREIAERRAAEAGCTVDVDFSEGYPPVVNNEELFELASRHIDVTELPKPLLIAEDFAFYQRHLPGVFLLLGTGTGIPLHPTPSISTRKCSWRGSRPTRS